MALKTNIKVVKERVRNSILEWNEDTTIQELKERFHNEYGFMIPRVGELNACKEWLRGLAINCDFYYIDIANTMAEWLEDSVESQMSWIDKKDDDLYWLLMAREIVKG